MATTPETKQKSSPEISRGNSSQLEQALQSIGVQTKELIHDITYEISGLSVIPYGLENLQVLYDWSGEVPVPKSTGAIICCAPHNGHPDGPLVRAAIPTDLHERLRFVVKGEHWNKYIIFDLLRKLFANTLSVDTEGGTSGIKTVLKTLKQGGIIGVLDEGTREKTDRHKRIVDREFQGLVSRMLMRGHGIPLILALIKGAEDYWPKSQLLPNRDLVKASSAAVIFGKPLFLDQVLEEIRIVRGAESITIKDIESEEVTAIIKLKMMELERDWEMGKIAY
jgi:1-acyl-sn-glycerol-3-phosphate acyltransferase